jgi:hypothetical protein
MLAFRGGQRWLARTIAIFLTASEHAILFRPFRLASATLMVTGCAGLAEAAFTVADIRMCAVTIL